MAPSPTRSDARRADDSVAAAARNLTVPLAEPLSAGCDAESLNEAVAAPVGERPVSLLLRLKDIAAGDELMRRDNLILALRGRNFRVNRKV